MNTDRKGKSHLTNESIVKKFDSSFELVNYAIQLAENMIITGRDARVKSDVQNRAMLILEEIYEGKDYFDEIEISDTRADLHGSYESELHQRLAAEERGESRKYRTAAVAESEH